MVKYIDIADDIRSKIFDKSIHMDKSSLMNMYYVLLIIVIKKQ